MPNDPQVQEHCLLLPPRTQTPPPSRSGRDGIPNLRALEGDFIPATALTQTLTRVFRAVAEGRIGPKSAVALTRVAATLLKSIDASSNEFQSTFCEGYWQQLISSQYNSVPEYTDDDNSDT
jgi:hypothetical protein